MTQYIWNVVEDGDTYYLVLRKGLYEVTRTYAFSKEELLEKPLDIMKRVGSSLIELGADWDEQAGVLMMMLSYYLDSAKNVDINVVKEYVYNVLLCLLRLQDNKEK